MDCFLIRGGRALNGTVDISGSKNSSLPILAATLMAEGVTTLHGVPRLTDINSMQRLLASLGCRVVRHDPPSTKATLGSNTAHVTARVDPRTGWLVVIAAIDNLVKGASGQAIQCANIISGLDETAGLPMVALYP